MLYNYEELGEAVAGEIDLRINSQFTKAENVLYEYE
jgi:hypothetical protein